ncbi:MULTISPECIES: type III polyketide synthase [Paenibacillus]|uniref:type III polyketide synthase n=1 Tax=Paenibacillus TaxID=44249 RepID=UPI0022B92BAD|nr:type III polyketide synthase [Paenibacillus caseinilyticus]MCZ8520492.1 type III polyketide synthase [Paenibacillus caseinilyticus]
MTHQVREDEAAAILGIGTALPAGRLDQSVVLQSLSEALQDRPEVFRWARRIFRQCGVETRYTCEPRLLPHDGGNPYLSMMDGSKVPTTRERMEIYRREALPLAVRAARKALADSGTEAARITHLLTVSCTGQYLPGLDAQIVRELGLSARTNRIPLQFLGCAAGLKAVSLSRQLSAADPSVRVLVVCVELCTLHIQPSLDREDLFAASFFGDGASACVIGRPGREPAGRGLFRLDGDQSVLFPDSAEAMTWQVGDYGFDLYLSTHIPALLARHLPEAVEHFMDGAASPGFWAIHPGGRGIVDALERLFGLTDEQTSHSRGILRDYGNLSSATILFVLEDIRLNLHGQGRGLAAGAALAFGPGLTAELVRLTYVPAEVPAAAEGEDAYV